MLRSFKSIGELIHYYRLINNYSQQDLANKLHVTISAVSSWERGVSRPGIEIAYELSRDMNMSLDEFYTGTINVKEKVYELSDQILFHQARMDVHKLSLNQPKKTIRIDWLLQGIHLQKTMIENHFQVNIETESKILKPISWTFEEIDMDEHLFPQELSDLGLHSKSYLIHTTFSYESFQSIKCYLKYHQETATLALSKEVIEFMTEGIPFDINDLNVTLNFLESESFKEGLQFLAKKQGIKKLQKFMINQYRFLMDYLKKD